MTARDRIMIVVVGIVALIGGSWFLVIQPKREEASKLGGQLSSVQSQLDSARSQLTASQAARNGFQRDYTALIKLGEAVPADDNVPSLIVQLQAAAHAAKVDFRNLMLNAGSSTGAPTVASPATSTSSSSSSSTASTSSASAAQALTAALPPGATVGAAGFPVEPFTFTFQGNFFHLSNFLNRIERFVVTSNSRVSVSGRLMTLNAISLGPGPKGFPQITAAISATTYLVPAVQGVLNGATPSGPAASSGTQTASTQTSGSAAPAAAAVATPAAQ